MLLLTVSERSVCSMASASWELSSSSGVKASLGELPFSYLVRDISWSCVRFLSSGIALPVCGLEIDGNAVPLS